MTVRGSRIGITLCLLAFGGCGGAGAMGGNGGGGSGNGGGSAGGNGSAGGSGNGGGSGSGTDMAGVDGATPGGDMTLAASGTVGANGGTVGSDSSSGPTVSLPAGSVASSTNIAVAPSTTTTPPAGAVTPVYDFSPDGIVFAHPVTVTLPIPAGSSSASLKVFWSKHDGSGGFEEIGGVVAGDGSSISVDVVHFSSGYVAAGTGTHTLSGSQIKTYITPTQLINQASDLSAVTPQVLAPDGMGGYTTLTGSGLADGSYSIPGVPDNVTVWVNPANDNNWYATSATTFDSGSVVGGRPRLTAISDTADSSITFTLAGLDSWQAGDELEAYSPEGNDFWFDLEQSTAPAVAATALTAYPITMSWAQGAGPVSLIDGSQGDTLTLAQLSQRTSSNSVPYLAMSKVFSVPSFTELDGVDHAVSGTFTDVATGNHIDSIALRVSQFETAVGWDGSHAALINPNAQPQYGAGPLFDVMGLPYTTQYGFYVNTADYLLLGSTPGGGDVIANGLDYGTPNAGSWATMALARAYYTVQYALGDGSGAPATFYGGISQQDSLAHMLAGDIVPLMSPVQSPLIGGASLFTTQTLASSTPTVSWTAPTLGTPLQYSVVFIPVYYDSNANNTYGGTRISFFTATTSVTVPPGVLAAAQPYVVEVMANRNPNLTAPNRDVETNSTSVVISALLTTPATTP
jgi:hypothetical protein